MFDNKIIDAEIIVAYYSLSVTIVGTLFNSLTFIVLCRSTFRNSRARPTFHYMRAIAVFDILMLYGWNLDHYLGPIHGFTIQTLSIPLCRFLSFFNYFICQSSAWLRVFVCVDRYLILTRLRRTWFSDSKHVLIVITCIITFSFGLNSLFFVFGCSKERKRISAESWAFPMYPLWDYINLTVYNCIPLLLMTIFNTRVISHLIRLRRQSTIQNSQIQHLSMSMTLVITTFLFLMMTIPGTVAFAFFSYRTSIILRRFLDGILYTYHILSFPLYMITFDEFRQEFILMITCERVKTKAITFNIAQPYLMSHV
ncbi:unnamed protein product [Adineta ricciae]|uniref:G-protein coupled receptors family 1 profile domain-containing protein n=1 Tax=Adineta ricciae TaxID=249248 RepID=A0A814IAJ7_ADIRI|nr:unnamed protein product [Adineta ricciae]CAF1022931.1 unnamed protein product [Adineta ricciae]